MAAAAPLLGAASPYLSAGSTLLNAFGESRKGKFDTTQAIANAKLDKQAATSVLRRGRTEESQLSINAKADQGTLAAGAAASGIDPSSGSALDLRMDSQRASQMDLITLRNNATQEALGYTRRSEATLAQAKQDNKTRRNQQFSSLLTSGLDLASKLPTK